MAYRGDNEPEYIDDEEYYDPDGIRPGTNVLGGSGSASARGVYGEPHDEGLTGGRDRRDARQRPARGTNDGRQRNRARNPAPSAANSEERRARLAGKHERSAMRTSFDQDDSNAMAAETGGGRLAGLRQRLSRKNDARQLEPRQQSSRIVSLAKGTVGGLGLLGGRLLRRGKRADAGDAGRAATRSAAPEAGYASANVGGRRHARHERANASKLPRIASDDWLDLDRKLDLIGVGLVFGAIVFVFSALSPEQGGYRRLAPADRPAAGLGRVGCPHRHVRAGAMAHGAALWRCAASGQPLALVGRAAGIPGCAGTLSICR